MQVVWLENTFTKGSDADTTLFKHQGKVPRYFSNLQRALALKKEVLARDKVAYTAEQKPLPCGQPQQQQAIMSAQTPQEMHQVCAAGPWCQAFRCMLGCAVICVDCVWLGVWAYATSL